MTTQTTTDFQLFVQGTPVPVSEAVYRAYYQCQEHARYLDHLAVRREVSAQHLDDADVPSWEYGVQTQTDEPERAYLQRTLTAAMDTLSPSQREGLWDYALGDATDRDLAARWHVSKSAACRRRQKACAQLRRYLNAHGISR